VSVCVLSVILADIHELIGSHNIALL